MIITTEFAHARSDHWERSLSDRFWQYIDRTTHCWLWTGPRSEGGYGLVQVRNDAGVLKTAYCHRLTWEARFGSIPFGKVVCHVCDTPACVNPQHLRVGTQADNMADKVAKGRGRWPKRAHLGRERALAMRRAYEVGGVTQSQLAKAYGVSSVTVSNVIRGRFYKESEAIHG